MATSPWGRRRWAGPASEFHALDLPFERSVWLCRPSVPALILGSSQSLDTIDRASAMRRGIEVVRRRSGGGVVFVHPDDSVWIDVTIPRADPLWVDDVTKSMTWLGKAFVRALEPWIDAVDFGGPFFDGGANKAVCFASASPGEVFTARTGLPGAKVLGISQRRGRHGARFQCVAYRRWDPGSWADLILDGPTDRSLAGVSVGEVPMAGDDLLEALAHVLSGLHDHSGVP